MWVSMRSAAILGWLLWTGVLGEIERAQAQAVRVVYVNQGVGSGSLQNGTSWANAYRELRDAIAAVQPSATDPVEIWVTKGIYKPTTSSDRMASFVLKSHLTIRGGFVGNETSATAPVFLLSNSTILSGDIGRAQAEGVNGSNVGTVVPPNLNDPGFLDNSFNVVVATNVTGAMLERLVIAGGCANADTNQVSDLDVEAMAMPATTEDETQGFRGEAQVMLDRRVAGGGIFARDVFDRAGYGVSNNLFLKDCFLVNNYARGYGGAMAAVDMDVKLLGGGCLGNQVAWEGGALWLLNCISDLLYVQFVENQAEEAGGAVQMQTFGSSHTTPSEASDPNAFKRAYGFSPFELMKKCKGTGH